MTTLTIQLPFEQKMELMKIAEESDLTVSQILRSFIYTIVENSKYGSKPHIRFTR